MNAATAVRAQVKLAELFPEEAIIVGAGPRTKSGVIEDLVGHAVALGYLPREVEEPFIQAILEREGMGTTALGNGIAFPHCQSHYLERFVGVACLRRPGIPFDAVDSEPVDSVFLTLAPLDMREEFFGVLGRLVAIGRNKSLRLLLRGCRTAEHVSSFLQELDQPVPADPGTMVVPSGHNDGGPRVGS